MVVSLDFMSKIKKGESLEKKCHAIAMMHSEAGSKCSLTCCLFFVVYYAGSGFFFFKVP